MNTLFSKALFSFAAILTSTCAVQAQYEIATFSADVTIPLRHRCMGVLPTKSQSIADPLEAIGFVITGMEKPIVYVAIDWCEIRNGAYDQWRDALAEAASTTRQRVLVSCLHQHDAPVTDAGAAQLLSEAGLTGELYDEAFHKQAMQRVASALKESLHQTVALTHIGTGATEVKRIASNRRVVTEDGSVRFSRGSASGGDDFFSTAPEGEIDRELKTISFWNEETPICALHVYATHPMSSYGQGRVSADFVGLARRKVQKQFLNVRQIYASGCSGDVTAGKFNDGSTRAREQLVERLASAMLKSWNKTVRYPVQQISFRNTQLELEFYKHAELDPDRLRATLADESKSNEDRILAAMGLSSFQRVSAGQLIDFPCVDFGPAQIVLFPGESFVGYQLQAQQLRPESFVVSIGYGECWPGYIPLNRSFADSFHDKWLWVGPGSENHIQKALQAVLFQVSPATSK